MIPIWLEPLSGWDDFQVLKQLVAVDNGPVAVCGISGSQKTHLVSSLIFPVKGNCLFITYSNSRAREFYEDMRFFYGDKVLFFPPKEAFFYTADAYSLENTGKRLKVLEALSLGKNIIVVASIESLLFCQVSPEIFRRFVLSFRVGDEIPLEDLARKVVHMGYERVAEVEGKGQFSLRGGIFDIFPLTADAPYRIEFFDNEVDSIRLFDPETQRSTEKVEAALISPARELVLTEESVSGSVSLLDYMGKSCMVVLDEPARIKERCNGLAFEFKERFKNLLEEGKVLPEQAGIFLDYHEFLDKIRKHKWLALQTLPAGDSVFQSQKVCNISSRSIPSYQGKIDMLADDIKFWKQNKYFIILLGGDKRRGEGLVKNLRDFGIDAVFKEEMAGGILRGQVVVLPGTVSKGFEYPAARFVLVSDNEIYGARIKVTNTRKSRKRKKRKLDPFTDLKVGDYVVHENYGIGKYLGIKKLVAGGIERDYLHIQYAGNDKLYVPIDQMDLVQPYVGPGDGPPRLSKLGGAEWQKTKERVRNSIRQLADDLLKLYAARQTVQGYRFSPDTEWQKEFEDRFPYEETPDQLQVIEEIKKDMESSKVMDRLLCGDVGYGKTEVAMRAAFKAVMDGKQVAVLAPTTILVQQHYSTFIERFGDFPFVIQMLSRFKTSAEQRKILKALREGNIDIIIGTHRLLGKDVRFRDLGLLIIDEEQKFGVAHKEAIKKLKKNVDVLSLTATPIPRTLHMSLVGIRDISIIETPPEGRYPVQTYVMEYNDLIIKEAILREVGRGGQVYFVYNRVESMEAMARQLQRLVPEVRIAKAHGQMDERLLEKVMLDFYEHKYDVLLCTTIIENGLDIPNVNTIIVYDAQNFGLAQLYQLRGRVGRSNRQAYAYFTYRKDRILSEAAEKRLQAIKEFTEFGAGFKIALRDLEIRGAGNLLGPQQHGHMAAVGYDLYCKLLEEAVRAIKGEELPPEVETNVDIKVNAYIEDSYISEERQKIEVYKKIAAIEGLQDKYDLEEELEDRFGDIPPRVRNLIDIAYVKALARRSGITEVIHRGSTVRMKFSDRCVIEPKVIMTILNEARGKLNFKSSRPPVLVLKLGNSSAETALGETKKILERVVSILSCDKISIS